MESISMHSDISVLKGVGTTRKKQLNKLGIYTISDLLYHVPRAYENRGEIYSLADHDTDVHRAYILTVGSTVTSFELKNHKTIQKFKAFDETGSCEVIFFNSPFVKDIFQMGKSYRFYGKLVVSRFGRPSLSSPKYEAIADKPLDDLVSIYNLTDGISSSFISKLIKSTLVSVLTQIKDPLPEKIRTENNLPTLQYALYNVHCPLDERSLQASRRRLAFDELFHFALRVNFASKERKNGLGIKFNECDFSPFLSLLPYELTNAQKNAINDIYRDTVIKSENGIKTAMARIITGDVGSGKTICAAAAIYLCVKSGFQTAFMAPTEILAKQHYDDLSVLFSALGIKVEFISGSTTQSKKNKIYDEVKSGNIDVLIGTHALLSEKINFNSLGLIITDEQHRFGVAQRAVLKTKTQKAHMLVMSATPIPRTLALTMYGDLDASGINEMPKGRQKVDTFIVDESYRSRLNEFIKKQVQNGGQCYVVCPSIEKEEDVNEYITTSLSEPLTELRTLNLKSVAEHTEALKAALPEITVSCVHGKMKAADKAKVMQDFAEGKIKVLVSTTVIEVGVNVPNASLIIIENAERFGLSQLHQLRGRVGRGARKSYCVLVSDSKSEKALARLNVIKSTYNGYEIAEKDLLLRGPGDFFSSFSNDNFRQSGGIDFKFAKLCDDSKLIDTAFSAAKELINDDPGLEKDCNLSLKKFISFTFDSISTIS